MVEEFSFNRNGSILKRVPKASRIQAAKVLTEVLERVALDNSLVTWKSLFDFARGCLLKPKRGGKKSKSLAAVVNRQITDFVDNQYKCYEKQEENVERKKVKKVFSKNISILVSSKLSDGDVTRAVRILSSDSKVLECSDNVISQLNAKHPDLHINAVLPHAPDESTRSNSILVSSENIRKGIRSFKNGSSAGPDGLAPQHLKDLISETLGEVSQRLVEVLVKFTNEIVLRGNIPLAVSSSFFGASLIALSKKDGGVRPIAIGNTLRRLAGKCCMLKLSQQLPSTFQPHQLGVGTTSGAEAVVHACRNFFGDAGSTNKVLLKIDFKNAFNTIRRDCVLQKVFESFPQIYFFVYQAYATPSNLFFGKEVLLSKEGVQQGDPLGPLLFSLAINDAISCCKSEFNMWYLDDGTLGGNVDVVLADFVKIMELENSLGLKVNPAKCEIVSLDCENEETTLEKFCKVADQIIPIKKENLTLLGAPVLPSAVDEALQSKLTSLCRMLDRLEQLDAHEALFLLWNCFAIPMLTYVLIAAASFTSPVLEQYDLEIQNTLKKILNVQLTTRLWEQCSLPVKFGGLGIRSAKDVALPAFLSSMFSCHMNLPNCFHSDNQDICLLSALSLWTEKTGIASSPPHPQWQKSWDLPLCNIRLTRLIESSSSSTEKSRLLAVSAPHSSHWLNALPIPSLGLKMDNSSFRIACALRLGSPLCHPHQCICCTWVDSSGVHGLSCKKSAGRFSRHTHVNNLIKRALESAHVPTILEPQGASRTDGKRPDGMTIFPWKMGKCMVWDFTCSDTFAPSHLEVSANLSGKVAERAEQAKLTKYAQLAHDFEIIPVCVETLGPWGPNGLKFVQEVGRRISVESGEPRSTEFLMQAIGMAVQRGNAASVLGTVCKGQHLEELYYL